MTLLAACGQAAAGADTGCPSRVLAPPGSGTPVHASLGEVTVDSAGAALCLHLDTRKLTRAHLMADTPSEPGATSSFRLALFRPDGVEIVDGWDVPVSGPTVFTNLEWSPAAGTEFDVVLRVATKGATPKPVTLVVSLFDPLE